MKTRLSHTFPSLPWRAGLPPLVLLFFLNIAEPAENSEDSAWWHPYIDEFLYIPFKEDIGVWGPADMVGGPKGKHGDIYSQRMVAGKVLWATPFMVDAGIGLPDIESCSDWLKIGALVRSATAFYGLEMINDVTKWVEIGEKQDLWYDLHDMAGGSIRPPTDQSPLLFRGQGGITVTVLESQPNEVIISASEIASGMDSILHFSEALLENSNHPEFQVELPEGKEVQELMWLEVGIPIPVRCATVTEDGFISIYQPYCWFTTDMKAKGTLRLRDTG